MLRRAQSRRSNDLEKLKPFKKFERFKSLKSRISVLRSFEQPVNVISSNLLMINGVEPDNFQNHLSGQIQVL